MLYFDHVVTAHEDGVMLETLLRPLHMGRTLRRILQQQQSVLVNGQPYFWRKRVYVGDHITVTAPQDDREVVIPEPIDIAIVYEDDHVLVVDKPAHVLIHPVGRRRTGTLLAGVVHYLKLQQKSGRVFLLHRLDQDTSGLVLLAKHKLAQERLARTFLAHDIHRGYTAFVQGIMKMEERSIIAPIIAVPQTPTRHAVASYGHHAVTHVNVMVRYLLSGASKVSLRLDTGRTHQIRVHLSYIGYPILGDALYGPGTPDLVADRLDRQALHASSLSFVHPMTKALITVQSPLPCDLRKLETFL